MSDEKSVIFYKSSGLYNFNSNEKQWKISIQVRGFTESPLILEETWDWDDEPDIHQSDPEEIVNLISEKVESYWISTARERNREKIKLFNEHMDEICCVWAQAEIKKLQERIKRLSEYIIEEDGN